MHRKKYNFVVGVLGFIIVNLIITTPVFADVVAGGSVVDTDGQASGTLMWSLDSDGVFVVTGVGPGATYRPQGVNGYDAYCPWNNYRSMIREVRFQCVFNGTSSYHYGNGASLNSWFANCINLERYSDIPVGVSDLSATFIGCEKLVECGAIPEGVVSMQYTFAGCKSITIAPRLPSTLTDYVNEKYYDIDVHVPIYVLSCTFDSCENLVQTPQMTHLSKVENLPGTFANCSKLRTIEHIPANIRYLSNTFINCVSVRGVFSCDAQDIMIQDFPFYNFSVDNEYILFVKSPNRTIIDAIRAQNTDEIRVYQWNDDLTVFFELFGGTGTNRRSITMQYGVNYENQINEVYRQHINYQYYTTENISAGKLPMPQKDDLEFAGWFYDIALTMPVNENDIINPPTWLLNQKYVTLYAKWIDVSCPVILHDYQAGVWHNDAFKVHFTVMDNDWGAIKSIQVFRANDAGKGSYLYYVDFDMPNYNKIEFDLWYGDKTAKLDEGTTQWTIWTMDFMGNTCQDELTILLDYSPPRIAWDNDELVLQIDDVWLLEGDCIVCADDSLSGMLTMEIRGMDPNFGIVYCLWNEPYYFEMRDFHPDVDVYCVRALDVAGNEAVQFVVMRNHLEQKIKRVIPRGNYD